jgi:hypothetical protein
MNWLNALSAANGLNSGECDLSDGSQEGDWRLPNAKELQSLVDFRFFDPALSDATGTAQWSEGDPFSGVQFVSYWSSTSYADRSSDAWHLLAPVGLLTFGEKANDFFVWPVRGGE